jgi:hypothetical protein
MLVRALDDRRNHDYDRRAIGFWMAIEGEEPVRPVRVDVSYEALANIDQRKVRDLDGALTTFDANCDRVDTAANCKFDAGEVEADLHEASR